MSIATQVKRLQDVRNQIRAKMVSLGLSTNTDLLQDLANDLDGVAFRGDASTTLSTSTRSKTLGAGYYTGGTIKVPSDYFPVNSTNTTATAGDVLSGKKFVNTSGATVTGSIATATAGNVSGDVKGDNPAKITLTTEKTSDSSTTTATAKATIAKNLYTGSSNIVADLTSKKFTATAETKLATSVTGSTTVPSTLPAGTVTITPNTDNTRRIYSDSTNKGFVTNVVLEAMPAGSYSPSVASHDITNPTASSSVTGSITSIASTTIPAGTDGTDYYTITPELTAKAGSSKAKGKATISTAGYLATGNTTSTESSKSVEVETSPGKSYYLKASSVTKEDPGTSYTNKATVTPSTSTQYVKMTAGYLSNSKIKVEAIPSPYFDTSGVTAAASDVLSGKKFVNSSGTTVTGTIVSRGDASATLSTSTRSKTLSAGYYTGGTIKVPDNYHPLTSSNTTATAGTVLSGYKFVDTSGSTVTGTIATADSSNVSGSVSGDDPKKITLTAASTSESSSTTATARAIVTKGLYTGSSNIEKDLTSKTITATAEAKLANTNGAIELTAGTSAFTKTSTADYSNGFITSVKVNPTPSQSKVVTPTMAGQTVSPDPDSGKLLSSVTVNAVPSFTVKLLSDSWRSDSNVTIGKYYYNVSNANITARNNLYVMPHNAPAAQSFGVYAYSQGRLSGANAGDLQFRAMAQPTSDLTYTVYYLN